MLNKEEKYTEGQLCTKHIKIPIIHACALNNVIRTDLKLKDQSQFENCYQEIFFQRNFKPS